MAGLLTYPIFPEAFPTRLWRVSGKGIPEIAPAFYAGAGITAAGTVAEFSASGGSTTFPFHPGSKK